MVGSPSVGVSKDTMSSAGQPSCSSLMQVIVVGRVGWLCERGTGGLVGVGSRVLGGVVENTENGGLVGRRMTLRDGLPRGTRYCFRCWPGIFFSNFFFFFKTCYRQKTLNMTWLRGRTKHVDNT